MILYEILLSGTALLVLLPVTVLFAEVVLAATSRGNPRDLVRRGKGYAFDFGVRHLGPEAPDIAMIIDADCQVAAGSVDRLRRVCARTSRPVEALYLMYARSRPG